MKDIILVGAGGHCKSCIDVIEQTREYNIIGLIDREEALGTKVLDYEIKWTDNDIPDLVKECDNFIVTVGQISTPVLRIRLFQTLKDNKANLPIIISPYAYVSKHAKIGCGTIIFHGAIINASSKIGANCIINSKSLIEHDAIVGDNCHISTAAIVNGGVEIGNNVFYGSGSVSKEYISVASDIVIGGGSLVRKSLFQKGIYAGNPVKKYK